MSQSSSAGKLDSNRGSRKSITTKGIGFILLGLSFLFWAIISAGYMIYGTSSEYLGNQSVGFLGITSIVFTVGGIFAVSISIPNLTRLGKGSLIASISMFIALQIAGFYFLFTSINGILLSYGSHTYYIYLSVFSTVFVLYLLIYVLFILPFLNRSGRKFLILGSAISLAYLVVLLIFSSHLDFSPSVPSVSSHPGAFIPISIQLFAPFFGFPAYVTGNYMLYVQPSWAMILPLISDIIFAALCFSIAGSPTPVFADNVGTGSVDKS